MRATCPAHLLLFDLITVVMFSTNILVSHYVVFSTSFLLPSTQVQVFSTAFWPQTPAP